MLAFLPMSWANAKYPEAEGFVMHKPTHEARSTNGERSVVVLSLMPIAVEGEGSYPDSTQDTSKRKFRDALGPPPVLIASEREFSSGAMELTTRFGHFCARSLPAYLQPGIGATIELAARCVSY
jgi:hypothetical protein